MTISSKASIQFARSPIIPSILLLAYALTPNLTFAQTKVVLNEESDATPAAAVYNGVMYLAWTGTDGKHTLNVAESTDGLHFGTPAVLNQQSVNGTAGPALAAFNGYLWLAWTGGGDVINLENSTGGLSFGNKVVHSNMLSYTTPAIGVNGPNLYVDYAYLYNYSPGGNEPATDHPLVTAYSADGVNFSTPLIHTCLSLVDDPYATNLVDSPTFSSAPFFSSQVTWFAATMSGQPCATQPSNYVTAQMGIGTGGTGPGINNGGVTAYGGAGVTSLGSKVWLAWVPTQPNIQLNVYQASSQTGPFTLLSSSATGQQLVGKSGAAHL
jgi:hypothetical protein